MAFTGNKRIILLVIILQMVNQENPEPETNRLLTVTLTVSGLSASVMNMILYVRFIYGFLSVMLIFNSQIT